MLPRKNRLTSRKDFDLIYRTGQLFSFGSIFLKIRETEEKHTRVGFSVGIKFSKKAVDRNRVKRQLREIVLKYMNKIEKNVDMVVMTRKKIDEKLDSASLEKDFKKALEKGKLIKLK